MKISKTEIEVCDKVYKFKKCTPNDVLQYEKDMQNLINKYKPLQEEEENLNNELRIVDTRIRGMENNIEAINKLDNPTDEQLSSIITYNDKLDNLEQDRLKLIQKATKMNKKHEKQLEEIKENIYRINAQSAVKYLEGMTEEYFMDNATQLDITIIKLIPQIKEMAETGISNKEIEKHIRKNVELQAKQSLKQKDNSFRRN